MGVNAIMTVFFGNLCFKLCSLIKVSLLNSHRDDIQATNKLSFNIHLWVRGPVRVRLETLANLRTTTIYICNATHIHTTVYIQSNSTDLSF